MIVFRYDKTFEGLLTVVFDAYFRGAGRKGGYFPDVLLSPEDVAPLFVNEEHTVVTDPEKSGRVWRGLEKRLSKEVRNMLFYSWLSEEPGVDAMLVRYIRRVFDQPRNESRKAAPSVATDFSDPDVLTIKKLAQRVSWERERLMQFTRFQKGGPDPAAASAANVFPATTTTAADPASVGINAPADEATDETAVGFGKYMAAGGYDGATYFAPVSPQYNALPLAIPYFRDRFRDQKWLIYDIRRRYGFYYDLETVAEVTMDDDAHLLAGQLDEAMLAADEKLFQSLWKSYFNSMAIAERINPRLQRQHMPKRFWHLLTEMQ